MKKQLPISYSDFKQIIENDFYCVDKSLFIQEVIYDAGVILITRPRRFGKTFNMSMLRYFFSRNLSNGVNLFSGLNIESCKDVFSKHHNQYPVIYLTFKDVKGDCYDLVYEKILQSIEGLYDEFGEELLLSEKLTEYQKSNIKNILSRQATQGAVENSLYMLIKILHDHYGKSVCVLIDEYDTPIQAGYLHGYYEKIISFFRNFLGSGLKDNPYLFKCVLTGILRVSKESLFSGLNNLMVYSILSKKYASYFGFMESDVLALLNDFGLQGKAEEIKNWYNGYQIGGGALYNPWSILNAVNEEGVLKPYWVNTSDNYLVRKLLIESGTDFKKDFESLLRGQSIECLMSEHFCFSDLQKKNGNNNAAVWNLLLMAGYLTAATHQNTEQGLLCQFVIPNREIRSLYRNIIEAWLSGDKNVVWYNQFVEHLLAGNMEAFNKALHDVLKHTMSYHDTAKRPELFYHGLMLGLTASLQGHPLYETKSNRESGYGRYDYLILSRDPTKWSIIFEFKVAKGKTTLDDAAQEALSQIDQQAYCTELQQAGIASILKIGLAFSGKQFKMAYAF